MRRWAMFWGIVLIAVGALMLLDNLGLLGFDIWVLIGPGFLVALGLWILLAKPIPAGAIEGESLSIPLQGASRGMISIRHAAGRLQLIGRAPAGELLSGSFEGGVSQRSNAEGGVITVALRAPSDFIPLSWPMWSWREGPNWNVALNAEVPLSLNCRTGAGVNSFDLRGLKVTEFKLRCGASEVALWLPEAAGHSRVDIRGGMDSIRIHVPENVAARIGLSSGVSSISVDASRFPRRNGTYESSDFDTAVNRVELRIRTGMSLVEIR